MTDKKNETKDIPAYLQRRPQLFVRRGNEIVDAPEEDIQVAAGYRTWPDKGPFIDGKRLTILTQKDTYHTGEEVRIIHVVESTKPDYYLYVAGPKDVYGEYVDGRLVTELPPK